MALAWSLGAGAEDFPGGDASVDEFEKGFAQDKGMTQTDKDSAEVDRAKIGGTLWSEFDSYIFGSGSPYSNGLLFNPNTLWLYLDARLKNDVRAVGKIKAIYDPTATSSVNPFTGTTRSKTSIDLDELKLLFSAKKSVFFTLGKQKIKWGSAQFWNPTDFLNTAQRNFLVTTDTRLGIPQLKTHVPVGASNFYLINGFYEADQVHEIRNSFRVEVPISKAEVALSGTWQSGTDPSLGADLSSALGPFDVYGELAYSPSNRKTFYSALGSSTDYTRPQLDWTVGLRYDMNVFDNDTLSFSLEYYRNSLGYTSVADYAYVFAAGAYEAFRLSQQYGMLMIYLPNPGSWNRVTLSLFNIVNLTDGSATTRLDTLFTLLDDLQLDLAVGVHYGNGNGELKYGGQLFDVAARLMANF